MKVIVEGLAKKGLDDIFYYNLQYSLKNAIDIQNLSKNNPKTIVKNNTVVYNKKRKTKEE